jgi:hypothetical protein
MAAHSLFKSTVSCWEQVAVLVSCLPWEVTISTS